MNKSDTVSLYIDTNKRAVFYRGYRLQLTRSEYCIILALYNSENYLGVDDLITAIDSFKDIGHSNVAVHVFNINSKTRNIDGNRLIEHTKKGSGYFINKDFV